MEIRNGMLPVLRPVGGEEEINALKESDRKDVVKLFQGIMKTLDHMRLDMANFMIQQARPLIMSQAVG